MKTIRLSNGMEAMVDDEDYEALMKWKWTAHYHTTSKLWYVERNCGGKTLSMHRQLMNVPANMCVDHKDRNTLNNQKSNLRIATRAQNNANRTASRSCLTSKFLGVAFESDRKKWTARIRKDGRGYRLGSFKTEREAAQAYNTAAMRFHGEFASLNVLE